MNQQLIAAKAAALENASSDIRWGFEQGAHWAFQQVTEQEPFAIVHIKDGCLVGSHRDQNKLFPDGQYGLWPVATPPAQPAPTVQERDVIKAAKSVLEFTEFTHRPPVRDQIEVGRMVMVRLHALADLNDAVNGIKENT